MPTSRAPCLSDALAQAYSDPHSGGSTASPSRRRCARKQHRFPTANYFPAFLLLLLALPFVSAIFDPGVPEPSNVAAEVEDQTPSRKPPPRRGLSSSGGSSISLVSPQGHPVSLHPGCRRTSDLFDNVCPSPWSPFSTQRGQSTVSRSELVICPLGKTGGGDVKERIFAITGTVTLPESTYDRMEAPLVPTEDFIMAPSSLGDKETYWPKPGDEGFWRQHDGELEWVPTEARALLEDGITPASPIGDAAKLPDTGTALDPTQAQEYDAWSASIGGEDSETWLSFEQWREKHLAAEREQEKQKNAAGRRNKAADRAKEKKQAPQQQGSEGADSNAGERESIVGESSVNGTAVTPSSSPSDTSHEDAESQSPSAQPIESQREPVAESSAENVTEEPAAVKVETSQDTGAIPAVADASDQLATLKHRWNFASFDCAAVVHRANPSAKFTSAILSEKKDRYMLSPCPDSGSEGQFVIVELCDEISVDTIVLANYEFFSRMFKRFRVRVSRNLNGGEGDWYDIGTFRARNIRGLQVFHTVPPTADVRFFRYVRIDFLEHYGSEYYCPLSLLRVYGLTQMDDYVREEEEMRKQREAQLTLEESESVEEEEEEEEEDVEEGPESKKTKSEEESSAAISVDDSSASSTEAEASSSSASDISTTVVQQHTATRSPVQELLTSTPVIPKSDSPTATGVAGEAPRESNGREAILEAPEAALSKPVIGLDQIGLNTSNFDNTSGAINNSRNATAMEPVIPANSTTAAEKSTSASINGTAPLEQDTPLPLNATATASVVDGKEKAGDATTAVSPPTSAQPTSPEANSKSATPNGQQQQQQQQQHHGGSESIYRTITKRLNTLELNATLSLQYMEHSRQQLREVFGRMERNQRDKIAEMLRELNASNWRQIESLKRRQQVDLQQALFEFDKHRQQTDEERRALLAQVHILSNEILLEKRFGIAQLVLLLGLFVFMTLTRGSRAAPLLHQGIARISRGSTPPAVSEPTPATGSNEGRGSAIASAPKDVNRVRPSSQTRSSKVSDRHVQKGSRSVRLRGILPSKGKRSNPISFLPSSVTQRSSRPITSIKEQKRRDESVSSMDSFHPSHRSSLVDGLSYGGHAHARPQIRLQAVDNSGEPDQLDTPINRLPLHQSAFEREDTPTNSTHKMGSSNGVSVHSNGLGTAMLTVTDESFSSDWGTERSDDDDVGNQSLTSVDWSQEAQRMSPEKPFSIDVGEAAPVSISSPAAAPSLAAVRRIEESDAEEDSPKWSPVKHRRSLKRPDSSGSNHQRPRHPFGHTPSSSSRVNTPTNLGTPPRRSFSPFHKNAEIEIN